MDRDGSSQAVASRGNAAFDELLVTLIWSGDRRAAERLAARWQPRLLRTARRLLGDEEEAVAAVQQSWLAIFSGIDRLRDPARFGAWAFAILHRRCASRIARLQKERARDGGRADEQSLAQPDERSNGAQAILDSFAVLPPGQRLAAHLHYVEGLTLREIARVANAPEGTIKSRLYHARKALKRALNQELEGVPS